MKNAVEDLFTMFKGFEELEWREVIKVKDKFGHVDEHHLKEVSIQDCISWGWDRSGSINFKSHG